MVQRLVGGEHNTSRGQQQTDQADNEWNCRRRQGDQRVLDRGSQRSRHDRVDQLLTQVRMIFQHPRQDRHPEQQQREDAQESVVGDERRLPAALIVAVLLHHRVGEPQHTMLALQPVRPRDDPVHQATQTFQAHRLSLPGTALAGQPPVVTERPRWLRPDTRGCGLESDQDVACPSRRRRAAACDASARSGRRAGWLVVDCPSNWATRPRAASVLLVAGTDEVAPADLERLGVQTGSQQMAYRVLRVAGLGEDRHLHASHPSIGARERWFLFLTNRDHRARVGPLAGQVAWPPARPAGRCHRRH